MPAKPRNNRVELRLTELEKKDWSEAAGGTRKLSDWIRAQCNAAARLARDENGAVVAKPVIVEDAIRRSVGDQAHRESRPLPVTGAVPGADSSRPGDRNSGKGDVGTTPSPKPDPNGDDYPGQCPRWMYHRPGVYCGACKRVIAK